MIEFWPLCESSIGDEFHYNNLSFSNKNILSFIKTSFILNKETTVFNKQNMFRHSHGIFSCKSALTVVHLNFCFVVFSTFKLRNMFSVKDSVPQGLRSRVVYKFSCTGCNASYIGETTCHICARVCEHLLSDKSSHVYRHLQSSRACHDSCTAERFTILDFAASKFQIKIKEAMHIKWENRALNQQLKHLELSLFCLIFYRSCYWKYLYFFVPRSLKVAMCALFLFPAYFIAELPAEPHTHRKLN